MKFLSFHILLALALMVFAGCSTTKVTAQSTKYENTDLRKYYTTQAMLEAMKPAKLVSFVDAFKLSYMKDILGKRKPKLLILIDSKGIDPSKASGLKLDNDQIEKLEKKIKDLCIINTNKGLGAFDVVFQDGSLYSDDDLKTKRDFRGFNPDYIARYNYTTEIESDDRYQYIDVMVKVHVTWTLLDKAGDDAVVLEGGVCRANQGMKQYYSATGASFGGNLNLTTLESKILLASQWTADEFRLQFGTQVSVGGIAKGGITRGGKTIVKVKIPKGSRFENGTQMCLVDEDGFKLGIGTVSDVRDAEMSVTIWRWLGSKKDKVFQGFIRALEDRKSSEEWFEDNKIYVLNLGYPEPKYDELQQRDY